MEQMPKVLIIDDEEVVLDSCTQILAAGNFNVTTAPDGEAGLELVEKFRPDIAFIDLKMPGISGTEVLARINEIDPTIVTVVITGYATINSAVEAMKLGAYDFLPKPFMPDEFRLITRRGLEKRRLMLETIALRKEKEMLRDNFAAIVAHELKAPVNAIKQNLYVLDAELSGSLNESQKNRLDRMMVRTDDLLKLIHSWLRVLSVDIGKVRENFKPLSIPDLISTATELVEPHAVRKDIKVIASLQELLSPIEGDEMSLIEALVNIIDNAIKYSYPSSKVSIGAKETGDRIEISISDTGVGIPKEELPRVLGGFYRSESTQAGEASHGLGLTISQRIIEAHNGRIAVDSQPGKSTTFIISLPALKMTEQAKSVI
jgi:signal transduction histidine kinase